MPIARKNYLLAFDYHLPTVSSEQEGILFIHSSCSEQSTISLSRLAKLYPNKRFNLVKKEGIPFPDFNLQGLQTDTYKEKLLPPKFHAPEWKTRSGAKKFGLVYFCVNMEIGVVMNKQKPDNLVEEVEYEKIETKLRDRYENILEFLKNTGLKEVSYVIDKNFQVWKLTHRDIEAWSGMWEVNGDSLFLPLTLLSPDERRELFELGRCGPAVGAIVNIGNFLGGSSIILGKGSKEENREKVFSFDPKSYPLKENYLKRNQVEDWVVFNQLTSEDGSRDWGKREDKRIRLLFIDGDHSYEECQKDIKLWSRYLVPGGVIALHDYSRFNYDNNIYEVVKAVYDTVIANEEFYDFRRKDYLFLATKKNIT